MTHGFAPRDLLDFMDYVQSKGLANPETSKNKKIAVARVLDIVGLGDDDDLREIEVEDLLQRFENKAGTKLSPGSLQSYKSRVGSSIVDFLRFKENPSGFKMNGVKKSGRLTRVLKKPETGKSSKDQQLPAIIPRPESADGNNEFTLDFPIVLRQNLVVRIVGLPSDLKHHEARKIANVVNAMVSEEE